MKFGQGPLWKNLDSILGVVFAVFLADNGLSKICQRHQQFIPYAFSLHQNIVDSTVKTNKNISKIIIFNISHNLFKHLKRMDSDLSNVNILIFFQSFFSSNRTIGNQK
jgi:hypothetical protein